MCCILSRSYNFLSWGLYWLKVSTRDLFGPFPECVTLFIRLSDLIIVFISPTLIADLQTQGGTHWHTHHFPSTCLHVKSLEDCLMKDNILRIHISDR